MCIVMLFTWKLLIESIKKEEEKNQSSLIAQKYYNLHAILISLNSVEAYNSGS